MEYVFMFLVAVVAFFLGAYCFNGFIVPLFYTIPRFRKENESGNLVKSAPLVKLVLMPFLAVVFFGAILYFAYPYYVDYPWAVGIGLGIAAIGVYTKMISKKGEKEAEFLANYSDFLKRIEEKQKTSKKAKRTKN